MVKHTQTVWVCLTIFDQIKTQFFEYVLPNKTLEKYSYQWYKETGNLQWEMGENTQSNKDINIILEIQRMKLFLT